MLQQRVVMLNAQITHSPGSAALLPSPFLGDGTVPEPPLAAPWNAPCDEAVVENQVDAIMRELMQRNDQLKVIEATVKSSEEFALLAEARLRSEEQTLRVEAQQREAVIDMAKELANGQASVLRQFESELQKELV
ncbi:MAG: hypothetical protein ACKPKO_04980, partial [Candidatus Fonsibacter sp.]